MPQSPGVGYRLLTIPLYLFWLLHAFKHGLKNGLPRYWRLRLGGFGSAPRDQVWVHASSVGEVRAATPLVHALIRRGEAVLFTSFTATGYQAIQHNFSDSVSSGVIPVDQWWHCRGFFRRHRIKLGLIMETELWPELLYQACRHDVKLLLINARLSKKSLDSGKFVKRLLTTTLNYFDQFLTRNDRDRKALMTLGAAAERIVIIGNLKSHIEESPQPIRLIERRYLILASSHSNEEQQFLAARPDELSHMLLVIAPRHPDRSAAVQTLIEGRGLAYAVRSKAQPIENDTEVYLADTLGELKSLMAYAEVVVMGGSFDSTGGHNLIEPASLGRAIITGPSDSNIIEDIDMLGRNQGVVQVADMAECWGRLVELLADPAAAEALGREAQARLSRQGDMIQKYLAAIEIHL